MILVSRTPSDPGRLTNPRPGFHEKDVLENQLHASVCAGQMKLKTAQRLISTDWLKTYNALVR